MNLPLTVPSVTQHVKMCPGFFETTPLKSRLGPDEVHAPIVPIVLPTKKTTFAKSTSTRMKNLKRSMMDDNRLLKLRDKILKRSKSSAGLITSQALPTDSFEAIQNKENELPTKPETSCIASPTLSSETERSRMLSPCRTRVKMGTRAFASKQFPNKSCGNIYDAVQIVAELHESLVNPSQTRSSSRWAATKRSLYSDIDTSDDDGEISLKSTSLSSLYGSERASENVCTDSENVWEAYVIRE